MTLKEARERLCALKSHVGREYYINHHAHDCFCGGETKFSYKVDEIIIKFIEDAVEEKIQRESNGEAARSHSQAEET